jgi:hypothetical protein
MLTKNFSESEMTVSKRYPDLAAKIVLTEEQLRNGWELARYILEKIRYQINTYFFKKDIKLYVSRWVVNEELNNKTPGASPTTLHFTGGCADVYLDAKYNAKHLPSLYWFAKRAVPVRELFLYRDRFDGDATHIHIAKPERGIEPRYDENRLYTG